MKKLIIVTALCAIALISTSVYQNYHYKKIRIDGANKMIEKQLLLDSSFLDVKKTTFNRGGIFDTYRVVGFQRITGQTSLPVVFECTIDNRIRKIECYRQV